MLLRSPLLLGLSFLLVVGTLGCGDEGSGVSVEDLCATLSECSGGDPTFTEQCIDSLALEQSRAEQAGCAAEFDGFVECFAAWDCGGNPPDCNVQNESYWQCSNGGGHSSGSGTPFVTGNPFSGGGPYGNPWAPVLEYDAR